MIALIRLMFMVIGAIGAFQLSTTVQVPAPLSAYRIPGLILSVILGAAVGYVVGGVTGRRLVKTFSWLESKIHATPGSDLLLAVGGLLLGFLLAWLISIPFGYLKIPFLQFSVAIVGFTVLGYLGLRLALRKRDDLRGALRLVLPGQNPSDASILPLNSLVKLLDTSVIVDGRVADIAKTGFVEGLLSVPRFVLRELQTIADSEDSLKRNRGRRGLDILRTLQHEPKVELEILERDYPDLTDVDGKLVRLARETGSAILTNDYNLNKIADLQGIRVLNLNELANALKPVVLPGEEMNIALIREGKEIGQGVGYLDDGTMVVVDGGKGYVGQEVTVLVTSVLQTPAGRMIFSKLKEGQEKTG